MTTESKLTLKELLDRIRALNLNQVLTILAILGILGALWMVIADQKPTPVGKPVTQPSISPFKYFIAGVGIIEADTENIAIGTLLSGTVDKVYVSKGQEVKKGAPLFSLDQRVILADIALKKAQVESAKAALAQAKANLKNAQDTFNLISQVKDMRAYTKEEYITRENNVLINKAAVDGATASLAAAQAQLNVSETNLDLTTVKAPLDCQVLQVNIHPGEFALAGTVANVNPLMLVGRTNSHHVRVSIDENDAWRFDKNSPAVVFLRGNVEYQAPLKFEYIEPYVVPKKSLTGDSTERVDTRVFQVIYSYDPQKMPSYLGQQVDVYIEAQPMNQKVRYGGPMETSR